MTTRRATASTSSSPASATRWRPGVHAAVTFIDHSSRVMERKVIVVETVDAGLARLRAPNGRVLYLEVRHEGARQSWFVHVDGDGRHAPRSYPCQSSEAAVYRALHELSGPVAEEARVA